MSNFNRISPSVGIDTLNQYSICDSDILAGNSLIINN